MPINRTAIKNLLEAHAFADLFIEHLGWDHPASDAPVVVEIGETRYALQPVAHKRGFLALHCPCIPDAATRAKLETKVSRDIREHLIIFADASAQRWQWVRRVPGQPLSRKEHEYLPQQPQLLIERIGYLAVGVDEEENIDLVDVLDRVKSALDVDKVTKKFFERFKKEHDAFLKFIEGIPRSKKDEAGDDKWYASVMLNRLMFIYFIQKKGFLDGDTDYLRNRLQRVQAIKGAGKFHTFYRYFLMTLCHEVLARKDRKLDKDLAALIGQVPYLNGGIFEPHEIEQKYGEAINIPDEAFQQIFDFFDQYEWHLDNRPVANANEINPDVLGYIFEKYINQKQMGAYYTKEDITEYISKNTILPCLFDKAQKACRIAFEGETSVWNLLKDDPDRYIYPAVRHGITCDAHSGEEYTEAVPYPPEIEIGLDTSKPDLLERRKAWNTPTPPETGLPTEIWRETVARRQRYEEIRGKLERGEVREINDLITLNLDIRQFAQDVIERCESPDLLNAFWVAIAGRLPQNASEEITPGITVLDPTCGSGAFLFAALNILEPLYEACLERMKGFLEEWGDSASVAAIADRGHSKHPNYAKFFKGIRQEIGKHPSPKYYIYKSIIIHNLFGVDLMKEAVEICKLRLFLKLVAQVEDGTRIEPLPDIDFNIRAGNTLVGFASAAEVRRSFHEESDGQGKLLLGDAPEAFQCFEEKLDSADHVFDLFRQMQTQHDMDASGFRDAKGELSRRLAILSAELDKNMARECGIRIAESDLRSTTQADQRYARVAEPPEIYLSSNRALMKWKHSHNPFHWFVDFYGIMRNGGFDVVIGNPPYIAKAQVQKEYRIKNYLTDGCSDIYANVMERTANLLTTNGRTGMIVPLSLTFSENFRELRELMLEKYNHNWLSSFARIPAALFSADVRVRNTIHIGRRGVSSDVATYSTVLHRWFEVRRPYLFASLAYASVDPRPYKGLFPKIGSPALAAAFDRCFAQTQKTVESSFSPRPTEHVLYFKKSAYNWLNFCRRQPPCYDENGDSIAHTKFGSVYFQDAETRDLAFLLLNGKIMFTFWCIVGDDFDLTKWMFAEFPIAFPDMRKETLDVLIKMADELEEKMESNVSFKLNAGKKVGNYNLAKCRVVTDVSDSIFADYLHLDKVWPEIELMYSQIVKTDFAD